MEEEYTFEYFNKMVAIGVPMQAVEAKFDRDGEEDGTVPDKAPPPPPCQNSCALPPGPPFSPFCLVFQNTHRPFCFCRV